MTRRKFLIQGAVLTAVSLLLRVTNMGYRSFLSQEMERRGMGLYQLIFSIFHADGDPLHLGHQPGGDADGLRGHRHRAAGK